MHHDWVLSRGSSVYQQEYSNRLILHDPSQKEGKPEGIQKRFCISAKEEVLFVGRDVSQLFPLG